MAGESSDVLISYSRKDQEFVRRLVAALSQVQRSAWVDWKDIPLTAKWLAEIESAIEAANTFIFVISPDSVRSEICRAEIHYANQHKKRFIGIVCRDVEAKLAPPELAEWQWLFFRPEDDFDAAFQSLIAALDTDLEHVRIHTRLLVRAREWEERKRHHSFLLRGRDLDEAKNWLDAAKDKKPEPTDLHRQYIDASRKDTVRRRRVGVGVTVLVVLLAAAAYGYFRKARYEDLISRHEAYAAALKVAGDNQRSGNFAGVVELLQQQIPKSGAEDLREFAWRYLWRLYNNHRHVIFVPGGTPRITLSSDSKTLAITNDTHTLTVWDVFTGKQVQRIEDPRSNLTAAFFAWDGTTFVSKSIARGVSAWEPIGQSGKKAPTLQDEFGDMEISPDGKIMLGTIPGSMRLVNLESGTEHDLTNLTARGEVAAWAFTADSSTLAQAYQLNAIRLFDTATGNLKGQIFVKGESSIADICWQDSNVVAIGASGDQFHEIVLWNLRQQKETMRLRGPKVNTGNLVSVACHPQGKSVTMLVGDATISSPAQTSQLIAWDPNTGRRLFALGEEETGFITALQFSPDGEVLATGSKDNFVRLWKASTGSLRNVLGIHHGEQTREHEQENIHKDRNLILARSEVRGGGISQVLFSRDGKTLVTASRVYGTVRIWNTDIDPEICQLPQRADHNTATAFSPNGARIVTGDRDGTIALWDAHQHSKLSAIQGHLAAVESLVFAGSGQRFASAGADGVVKLWRTTTLEQEAVFAYDRGPSWDLSSVELFLNDRVLLVARRAAQGGETNFTVWDLKAKRKFIEIKSTLGAFAANGSRLVSIDHCNITVWNVAQRTSHPISNVKGCASGGLQQAALSPDGDYLAIGDPEAILQGKRGMGGIRLFDLSRPGREKILPLAIGHYSDSALASLAFAPDSRWLATVSALADAHGLPSGAVVTVWDVERGEKSAVLEQPTTELCAGFRGASCGRIGAFSRNSETLAVIAGPGLTHAGASEITLWHWKTQGKKVLRSQHRVDRLIFSPDGETFATLITAGESGEPTVLWETRSEKEVATLGNYWARIDTFNSTVNGRMLAVASENPASTNIAFRVWNLSTGQTLQLQPNWGTDATGPVTFSPGSPRLGVRRGDESVLVWDLDRGQAVSTLRPKATGGEAVPIPSILLSPDGALVVTKAKNEVLVWDLSSGKILKRFAGSSPMTLDAGVTTLATTIDCKTVKLWNLSTGRLKVELSGNTSCPSNLALSTDGKMLASVSPGSGLFSDASGDGKLWDMESKDFPRVLEGYEANWPGVASFAPDGKTLATSGKDGSVNLWDPLTGRRLLSLQGPKQAVTGLEFSRDGQALFVGYETEVQIRSAGGELHAR